MFLGTSALFGAPVGAPEFDKPAHTKNEAAPSPHYLHISISADQAQAMRAAIADRTANPGDYNLIFNNCAGGFVESVLHAGGVFAPHAEIFGTPVLYGKRVVLLSITHKYLA